MMIWLSSKDSHGAINLLGEEKPNHFMSECHL